MRRLLFLWIPIFVMLILAACQGRTQTEIPPVTTLPIDTVVPTETFQPPTPTPEGTAPVVASTGCTVVSLIPTPDPNEDTPFPMVDDDDWVLGPKTASVTFVEYGDFQ